MNLPRRSLVEAPWLITAVGWMARGTIVLTQLWLMRQYLVVLGTERYAVVAVIVGLSAWFALADLGMGASLQNAISRARAMGKGTAELEQSAAGALFASVVVIGLISVLFAPWLADVTLGKFSYIPEDERIKIFRIGAMMQVGAVLGTAYSKVLFAHMRGVVAHLLSIINILVTAALVSLVLHLRTPSLSMVVVAILGPSVLTGLIGWIIHLGGKVPVFAWASMRSFISQGSGFFAFYFLGTATINADLIVAARALSAAEMIEYLICLRLFGVVGLAYASLLSAVWPVCAEAIVRSEGLKVKKILVSTMVWGALGVVIVTVGFIFARDVIMRIIAPREHLQLSIGLLLAFGALQLIRVWCDAYATVLQSSDKVAGLLKFSFVQAVISVLCQTLLVRWFGAIGIVLGVGISFVLTVGWKLPRLVDKLLAPA